MIMKALKLYTLILFVGVFLTSCFDDNKIVYTGSQVEFEDAVMRTRPAGLIFPLINLTRASGTPNYQVNLVGEQLELTQDLTFTLDEVPASLLNATTIAAEEGVHFTLNGNTISFPQEASVVPANPFTINSGFPAQAGKFAVFVIRLDGNDQLLPSENYRRLGFRIDLKP
jgi:hypothetical protein